MTQAELKETLHLAPPQGKVRMVLDTDTYNEIDDQYALAYALLSPEKLEVEAFYAAPFYGQALYDIPPENQRAQSPGDGMEKSYQEILRVLHLMGRDELKGKAYRGSDRFMEAAGQPVQSPAAQDLVSRAMAMPQGQRLYVVAIGAITNVASALLLQPEIKEKIVVVWLGGNGNFWPSNKEFNLSQDILAARTLFDSGVPLVQIPAMGVTSALTVTEPELRHHLKGKTPLCDYLYQITCQWAEAEKVADCWSKAIWDISAIAWLLGGDEWMDSYLCPSPVITFDNTISLLPNRHLISQVLHIRRDYVFTDLFRKLAKT